MSIVRRSSLEDQYVRVQVRAKDSGTVVNITTDVVEIAVIDDAEGNEPTALQWTTAAWETDATTNPDTYFARVLLSGCFGASPPFTKGDYRVWCRVHDNPELVVEPVYTLVVF